MKSPQMVGSGRKEMSRKDKEHLIEAGVLNDLSVSDGMIMRA